MWLYLIIFLMPVCWYFFHVGTHKNVPTLAVLMSGICLFVGFADMLGGYDRYIYGEVFDTIADITTVKGNYITFEAFSYFNGEFGYTFLNIIISFITENRYIFILLLTLLIYSFLFISVKKYAEDYPLAIIMFLGLWFFFSFTYLRQVLGATIVWLGIQYVIDRKFWKFLIITLIGFSVHNSAIIFFPLYFVPIRKFSQKKVIWLMLILLAIGLSPIPNMLFQIYDSTSITGRNSESNATASIRVVYILEAIFFAYFILKNYSLIPNTKKDIVLMNIGLMFCCILLLFVRSENGGRLSWYYVLGIITTISYICTKGKSLKNKIPFLVIFLSLFLYLRIYINWEEYLNLYPYKTFLSNGHRTGDSIWEKYEYNYNYDQDKFCRKVFRFTSNI